MKVEGLVVRKGGKRLARFTAERSELAEWFKRNKDQIRFLKVNIGLTCWLYDWLNGWFCGSTFHYVPNRPDLWKVKPTFKPAKSPFK